MIKYSVVVFHRSLKGDVQVVVVTKVVILLRRAVVPVVPVVKSYVRVVNVTVAHSLKHATVVVSKSNSQVLHNEP